MLDQMHQETNYLLTMTVYRRVITMHFCGCELNELGGDELRYKVYISRYNRTMETLKVDAYMSDGTPYENVEFNENPEPLRGTQMVKPFIFYYGNKRTI